MSTEENATNAVDAAADLAKAARNRTWSAEITYKNGGSDREVVKCPERADVFSLVTDSEGFPFIKIDGEGALVMASLHDVARVRVSKGA